MSTPTRDASDTGDPREAWAHFLTADLFVAARSSFSGVASILRRHTNGPCSSLSISLFSDDSTILYPNEVEYVPPGTKSSPKSSLTSVPVNATLEGCIVAFLRKDADPAQTRGIDDSIFSSTGLGDVSRALDCPGACLEQANGESNRDSSARKGTRYLRNGEKAKKKTTRHCPAV